jgi:hypothetical protein
MIEWHCCLWSMLGHESIAKGVNAREHIGVLAVTLDQAVSMVEVILVLWLFIRHRFSRLTFTAISRRASDRGDHVLRLIEERQTLFG